jgi:hypothetical protein
LGTGEEAQEQRRCDKRGGCRIPRNIRWHPKLRTWVRFPSPAPTNLLNPLLLLS